MRVLAYAVGSRPQDSENNGFIVACGKNHTENYVKIIEEIKGKIVAGQLKTKLDAVNLPPQTPAPNRYTLIDQLNVLLNVLLPAGEGQG